MLNSPTHSTSMYHPKHRDTTVRREKVSRQQRTAGKRDTEGAVSACEPGGVCETSKGRGGTGQTGWRTGINTEDRPAGERPPKGESKELGPGLSRCQSSVSYVRTGPGPLVLSRGKHTRAAGLGKGLCRGARATAAHQPGQGGEGCPTASPEPFRFLSGSTLAGKTALSAA